MSAPSSAAVEHYLYSNIVLPLKKLDVPFTPTPSPLRKEGEKVLLWVKLGLPALTGSYPHGYQRTIAQRARPSLILLETAGGDVRIGGCYQPRRRTIVFYAPLFRQVPYGRLVLRKLESLCSSTYPFTKVDIVEGVSDIEQVEVDTPYDLRRVIRSQEGTSII